ncbi:hypothetical protein O1611_g4113 [Lasiodiplodia mahajangana]|uniref:Uncharacterized protein n=1 Tax=Lasiodiplodia mahajangana TaxID=1108764 RepID=A0ACC2JQR9_9PEZI|nr:hypothetical protein O1611_g4113 [Lasiodiplodia mahajangana]
MDRGLLPSPEEIQKIIEEREHFRRQAEEERRQKEEERRQKEEERRQKEEERRQKEEERRQKEEERRQKDEERQRRIEAEQHVEEERQQRIKAEAFTSNMAFIPYLYYCYVLLFLPISAQKISNLSSSGGFTDVKSRFYPRELRPWTEFTSLHNECFKRLSEIFGDQQLFLSINDIRQVERDLTPSPLSGEPDLRPVEMLAVERRAKTVFTEYLKLSPQATTKVIFRSNAYSLRSDTSIAPILADELTSQTDKPSDHQVLDIEAANEPRRQPGRGRSWKRPASSPPTSGSPSPSKKGSPERRIVPDRWCIREDSKGFRSQLFVIEYKAAHKLTVETLRLALNGSTDSTIFTNAVRHYNQKGRRITKSQDETKIQSTRNFPSPSTREAARNKTAQVLTQAFHYMVDCGLAYSYVTSGEGFIFLYIDQSDPTILYYHLALPKDNIKLPALVNAQPVEKAIIDEHAHLMKHTPIALVLTVILLSMKKTPLSAEAKSHVQSQLVRWGDLYDLDNASDHTLDQVQPTEAIRLRPIEENTSCKDPEKRNPYDDGNDDDPGSIGPPSAPTNPLTWPPGVYRPSNSGSSRAGLESQSSGKQSRGTQYSEELFCQPPLDSYCTQECLLGLKDRRPLDENCPNVGVHRQGLGNQHHIDTAQLRGIIRRQLDVNFDDSCQALDSYGKFGAIGALFKITARPYGYTLVTKGVQTAHRSRLSSEAQVYARLSSLQGTLVPVYLGLIDLTRDYILGGGAHVTRMMLLSYGGETVTAMNDYDMEVVAQTLMQFGVEHEDLRHANMLWNEELGRVMVIDFDRATLYSEKRVNSMEPKDYHAKRRKLGISNAKTSLG